MPRRRLLALLGSAALAPLLTACGEGDGFPIQLVSDETVAAMGLESWQRIRQQTAASGNADLQDAAASVAARLLAAADEDAGRWEVVVFAGDEVNAFALPGGKIGVFEGMFRVATDADRLAAVLGHEVGHIRAEHSQERLSMAAAKQLGLRLVSVALQLGDVQYANEIAALLGIGVEFGMVLPYSRSQELEADRLGVDLMSQAGFAGDAAVALWRDMARLSGGSPAFLSTHPAPEQRIEALKELLPGEDESAGRTGSRRALRADSPPSPRRFGRRGPRGDGTAAEAVAFTGRQSSAGATA